MPDEEALRVQMPAAFRRDVAARALYRAELAVHDAHQSHVDAWIRAANDHLHEAMVEYLEADAMRTLTSGPTPLTDLGEARSRQASTGGQ